MKNLNMFLAISFATLALSAKAEGLIGKIGEDLAKDTVKIIVKECATMPLINEAKKHAARIVFPAQAAETEKADKLKKETAEMLLIAKQISQFKAAGADKKFIASLSEKLTAKIQKASLENPCCKK